MIFLIFKIVIIINSGYIYKVSSVWHVNFSLVFNNDNKDVMILLHSETKSLRVAETSFLFIDLVKKNNNNNK